MAIHIHLHGKARDANGPAHEPAGSSKGGQFTSGSGGGGSATPASASSEEAAKPKPKHKVIWHEGKYAVKSHTGQVVSHHPEMAHAAATSAALNKGGGMGPVSKGKNASQWLNGWVWGADGLPAGVFEQPSGEVLAELAKYAPKAPMKLYRAEMPAGDKRARSELASWTKDKELAESLAEDRGGAVVSQTFKPEEILCDFDALPDDLKEENEMAWSEVIIAHSPSMKQAVKASRATKQ